MIQGRRLGPGGAGPPVAAAGEARGNTPSGGGFLRLAPRRSRRFVERSPVDSPRSAALAGAAVGGVYHAPVPGVSGTARGQRGGRPLRPRDPGPRSLPATRPPRTWFARLAEAHARAAQPDRHARSALLVVLAISMFFTFVSAGRVLRPHGLPRKGSASPLWRGAGLGGAAHGDRRRGRGIRPPLRRVATQLLPAGERFPAASGVTRCRPWDLHRPDRARRGSLAIVAQYFRSARVKAWAALQDEAPP